MPFADVAVNAAVPLLQTFTYRIPDSLRVEPGQAVYVPFGLRTLQGVVMAVREDSPVSETRDIAALIESRPVLSAAHVGLAAWMSEYYLAPLFDCIGLMLPPGSRQRPLTLLRPRLTADETGALGLSDEEAALLNLVIERGEVAQEEVRKAIGKRAAAIVASLLRCGCLERIYRLRPPSARPKAVRVIRLSDRAAARRRADELRADGSALALRRAGLLELLISEEEMPLSRARASGLTPAFARDLTDGGIAVTQEISLLRDPLAGREFAHRAPPRLTPAQEAAARAIARALEARASGQPAGFLLHGVTGSGKTEVYLAALDKAVSLGQRAIVLVPEISLTPQTVRRFAERFPRRVAVMHSGLSLGEHFDMWQAVRDGRFDVVVGPRGALLAPQPDLGLLIIDEEHEWTYKQQDSSPRYHAGRVARELCCLAGAVLVLGSATPDVESYFRAQEGDDQLLELPERVRPAAGGGVETAPLPGVEVVDLREELKAGNRSIFSRPLARGIREALDSGEQVVLFLNRRGTASFVQCRDCGYVAECRSCSVALTYHEPERALVCHYCNRRAPLPASCPRCEGDRIRMLGLGTERVEEEVKKAFPAARTLRWDRDVTRGRDTHESILARFLAHEADVLIGTQMVAKGLDMPLVTLVGVISADTSLHLPDFRAGERTFQLLEQVAGRAGRGAKGGRVVIQTYTPEHPAIESAARHDYRGIAEREIAFRRRLGYPPFGRLAMITLSHTGAEYAREQAAATAQELKQKRRDLGLANIDILGPSPAFAHRVRGRWRWNILLRGSDPATILRGFPLRRGWTVDVDPISIL